MKPQKAFQNQHISEAVLCIRNETELYHRYSIVFDDQNNITDIKNAKINDEILNYLIAAAGKVPRRNDLRIVLKMPCTTNIKSELIEDLIKEAIRERLIEIRKNIKRIHRNTLVFTVIGMAFIAFTQISKVIIKHFSLNELIIVASWVFMWKAVELFFFERTRAMKEKVKFVKLYHSAVSISNVDNAICRI